MTILYQDPFTYANGNLSANAGWTNNPSVGGQQIVVNTNTAGISSAVDDILCRYTLVTSAANHIYVQAKHNASFNTGGVGVGMAVCCCIDSGGAVDYVRFVGNLAGWELAHFAAGAFTSLGSGAGTTFANGDSFRLEYDKGTGAWLLYKFTTSVGASFATGTDPAPRTGTQFGVGYSSVGNSSSGIDDFEFGDFSAGGVIIAPMPYHKVLMIND